MHRAAKKRRGHDITLITTIAFGLTATLICGLLAKRLGFPPIVGYLIAGFIVGPHTPGFTGDLALANSSPRSAWACIFTSRFDEGEIDRDLRCAGPRRHRHALRQGSHDRDRLGRPGDGGVLGIAVSVASTVVLLRVLMDHGLVETTVGRAAVG